MAFCGKCGHELADDMLFCNKCGARTELGDKETVEEPKKIIKSAPVKKVIDDPDRPEMDLNESLKFVEDLQEKYHEMEKLAGEAEHNLELMKSPVETNYRRHSFIRFYWPFMLIAFIAFDVLFIWWIIMAGARDSNLLVLYSILLFAVPVALLIIGIPIATVKRNNANKTFDNLEELNIRKRRELKDRTEELKREYNSKESQMAKYNKIVPQDFRSSASMARIRILLKSGKATDYYDALEKLSR